VVVRQTDGEWLLQTPEGNRTAPLVAGRSCSRRVGVEHNVVNNSAHEVVLIDIEMR
jgi:hypothetical protein